MSGLTARGKGESHGSLVNLIAVDTRPATAERLVQQSAERVAESGTAGPQEWAFWRTAPADGARNMAIDAALLAYAGRTGQAVFRTYQWSAPTLSLGRNESTHGRFDDASVLTAGLSAVRRPTGGRALLHDREVTYSAVFPLDDGVPWRAAYAVVNRVLIEALQSLGVGAELSGSAASAHEPIRPTGALCFAAPSSGEVTVNGAKLVGSSVWRDRGAYLQHGSILLHDDQGRIALASREPIEQAPAAAGLAALMSARGLGDAALADLVITQLAATLPGVVHVTALEEDASLQADIARFDEWFRRPEWLWRR